MALAAAAAPLLAAATAGATAVPGGYDTVADVASVPVTGGQATATVGGARVVVDVPSGAFPGPVQLVLTSPDLAAIGDGGRPGLHAAAGVGVVVESRGQPLTGPFARPLSVLISQVSQGGLPAGASVVSLGPTPVGTAAQVAGGGEQVTVTGPADLAVLVPGSPTVAGATAAQTGVPVVTESVAGAALIAGGSSILWRARRRRRWADGLDGCATGH